MWPCSPCRLARRRLRVQLKLRIYFVLIGCAIICSSSPQVPLPTRTPRHCALPLLCSHTTATSLSCCAIWHLSHDLFGDRDTARLLIRYTRCKMEMRSREMSVPEFLSEELTNFHFRARTCMKLRIRGKYESNDLRYRFTEFLFFVTSIT